MESGISDEKFGRDEISHGLVDILKNMTSDWEMDFAGEIGPQTRLVADLAFESIDIVQLVVAIQMRFQRRELPFEELLMKNGRYVDEITVNDAVGFLYRHLNGRGE